MHEHLSDFDLEWCSHLINSPDYAVLDLPNRRPPAPWDKGITNTLLSETLNTDKTIREWVVLKGHQKQPGLASPEFIVLFSLGTGLDGHKGIAHGGFSALVIDQVIGTCATMTYGPHYVTVDLWQKFRRSVPLPSVILCRAVCTQVQDGRLQLKSTIEDGMGTIYCEGGAMYALRKKRAKAKI